MVMTLFAPISTLVSGLIVGIVFGFLLQKAHVTRFNVIVGQLLLRDFTVMKVIMTAIAVGSIGIYSILTFFPQYSLMINSTTFAAAAIGGAIFGIGMAIMGYCPGTGIGALAEGSNDMWFGILGMVFGAGIYAHVFEWIQVTIKPASQITSMTLPEYFGVSPWIVIVAVLCMLGGLITFDKKFFGK